MDIQELLRVENITKIFKNRKGNNISAVKEVSFSLTKGECLGIVGESGCGKSTLARIITGIEESTSGKIFLEEILIEKTFNKRKKDIKRNIQMVFQDPLSSFSPRMTIEDYLWEPLRNYEKISKKEALPIIENILEKVGLSFDHIKKYPHQFSGGQLQRIVIARAVIIEPKLIICDEATSSLDVSIQNKILELLEELKNNLGLSYIFIGHDLATVQKISDRIIVMYMGKIVEILNSENFKENAKHPYTKTLINSIFEV